jgi:hypothetical protein
MQAFDAMVHLYLPTKDFRLWAVRIFMNRDTEVEIPGFNHMFSVADLLKEHNIPVKTDIGGTPYGYYESPLVRPAEFAIEIAKYLEDRGLKVLRKQDVIRLSTERVFAIEVEEFSDRVLLGDEEFLGEKII